MVATPGYQMDRRCPNNRYIGIAMLHDWQARYRSTGDSDSWTLPAIIYCIRRYLIIQRGYPNVISTALYMSSIYELNPKDEASLEIYHIYDKKVLPVQPTTSPSDGVMATKKTIDTLVHIDIVSTSPDISEPEYINHISMALQMALRKAFLSPISINTSEISYPQSHNRNLKPPPVRTIFEPLLLFRSSLDKTFLPWMRLFLPITQKTFS